jgi:hypothetical protein
MYILNEEKIFSDTCDDRTIAIHSETGIYYGINGLSSQVFNLLSKGTSPAVILAALKKIPSAPEDIEQRLQQFVDYLIEKEILIAGESAAGEVEISLEPAVKDNFELLAIEYADAQELLLADPIEEANEWKQQ